MQRQTVAVASVPLGCSGSAAWHSPADVEFVSGCLASEVVGELVARA